MQSAAKHLYRFVELALSYYHNRRVALCMTVWII